MREEAVIFVLYKAPFVCSNGAFLLQSENFLNILLHRCADGGKMNKFFIMLSSEATPTPKPTLIETVANNAAYVLSFFAIIVAVLALAFAVEKLIQKQQNRKEKFFTARKMAVIGMFSALSAVLMLFEIPMPFAPSFYKLDFSEIPVLIGSFAFGPATGVMIEFIKILLKLVMKGTSTAFIGELANFVVGCSFALPAAIIYEAKKTKKGAFIGCVVGTLCITAVGTSFNAIYLLPAFAKFYGMPLNVLIGMGEKVNHFVKSGDIVSFVVACVAPLNLIKGTAVSIFTLLVYKPLSPIIKGSRNMK